MKYFVEYEPDDQANHQMGQDEHIPVHSVVMIKSVMHVQYLIC
jgi:hypothetical protein